MYGSDTSRCDTRRGFPSASLNTTWPGPSWTWMLGGSIDTQDSRKKLFVAPESRSARRGRRIPATSRLTIIRRESPLVVVAFDRARSTDGLGGRAATGGPEPPFKLVGRPAPTGLVRFFDELAEHLPHDGCSSHLPTSVLARGIQLHDVLDFGIESRSSDVRYGRRPCRT